MDLLKEINKYKKIIEKKLEEVLPKEDCMQGKLCEAMRYSIFAGGKRIRPILNLKTYELISGEGYEKALPLAAGIEMIHTYSLIHDDLPAMDNDDYRRGKLTNHKIYGEAMAILAGDALLNLSYETMVSSILEDTRNSLLYAKAVKEIGSASGIYGMIGGQSVDMMSSNNITDKEKLNFIHNNKTTALIEASIVSGGMLANGTEEEIYALRQYGKAIGLCFQIRDDILDKIGDKNKIGKKVGSDESNNKLTYITLYGIEKSIEKTKELYNKAIDSLKVFKGKNTLFLENLADYLVYREN
ncbi:farnesyl diphosphate synthase Fps [Gottschalkia purinilytica]|uniref:Farnesyl diphosphate synthase n=1 Tax=Gottschalkia purinilytica TaxID=1503 RepID=A0A0L0W7G2_GOTPU|nr:farnesyl diphosphate synthase [Gottschalkia purinilytica]KNF07406.1 farnesyl diphosphate synthase Fps [Gottschalkia purinilytica]